jgi:Cu+-exporting ATPase
MAKDLVCGMQTDAAWAAGKSVYEGRTFYFCAPGCKKMFDAAPDRYVTMDNEKDHPDVFDPVCGIEIDSVDTAEHTEYAGKTYYFCCPGCKQLFNTIPEMYEDGVDNHSVNQQQPNQEGETS